jgi:butyryl-CoA:acetate CoA-transferase
MNFMSDYKSKLVSAEEAVKVVKSGDWVEFGHFTMAPTYIEEFLVKRIDELWGVNIRAVCYPGITPLALADPTREHFIFNDWHFSAGSRVLHDKGLCNYIPMMYHEGPMMYDRLLESDVFIVKVAPMDSHGYFNFGPSNSIHATIAKKSKIVIVEVNDTVPICLGGNDEAIHISDVDLIVESDNNPLLEVKNLSPSEVDLKVAEHVLAQIEDGSCIQLGIGAMPNAIGMAIAKSDLKNLGGHTEMMVDAYVDMYEAGVMNGKCKTLDKGRIAYTFALGSQKLYDFLDNNRAVASYQGDYTNSPSIAAQNDKLISINNAIEVDLYGQVCSESCGIRHISGTGGQLDFIYAAYHSSGGKGLICLSSAIEDKKGYVKSRIVPTLTPGAIVTVPRTICNYVVTEYGVATLKGKSTWQRAEALIAIAHPSFRDYLIAEAEKQKIWVKSNKCCA